MIGPIEHDANLATGIELLSYLAAHPHTERERQAALYCAEVLRERLGELEEARQTVFDSVVIG